MRLAPPWPSAAHVRTAAAGMLDLVLPPRALDDDRRPASVQSPGLTTQAWSRITFIEAPFCRGCGAPFEYETDAAGGDALCAPCQARRPAFDAARAACVYDEHCRDLILKLKHADRTDLAPLFARWLARAGADLIGEADAVVPVPLHSWRLLRRRYNQAAEIARPLARQTGLAYWPGALVRDRPTGTQAGRSAGGRRRNVAGAFAVPKGQRTRLAGAHILLVDDVLTTGATAEGCVRALKAAGAVRVDLAVIARVKERTPLAI